MDILEFISSIVGSLAWPLATIALVVVLRSPLGKLLHDLRRLRYKDVELDFGREVRKLEDEAKAAGLRLPEKPKEKMPDAAQIVADASRLAGAFPEPAVGLAWTAVEHELLQLGTRLGVSTVDHRAPARSISMLHNQGYLDSDTRGLLDRMRNLRNMAVHPVGASVRISSDEAREFIALTEAVIDRLKDVDRPRED